MKRTVNYKIGALKRKFKTDSSEPGTFISKMNEAKSENIKSNNEQISKTKLSIMGLV